MKARHLLLATGTSMPDVTVTGVLLGLLTVALVFLTVVLIVILLTGDRPR